MPQVIFRYDPDLFPYDNRGSSILTLGTQIIPMIAEAVTTEVSPLTCEDIDWIPQAYELGYSAGAVAIELRTFGLPERKAKLKEAAVRALKTKILALPILARKSIDKDAPLIWVQFQDPDGVHV